MFLSLQLFSVLAFVSYSFPTGLQPENMPNITSWHLLFKKTKKKTKNSCDQKFKSIHHGMNFRLFWAFNYLFEL